MRKPIEQCVEELKKFIDECDGDVLAAIYEATFTGTKNVRFVEDFKTFLEFDTDEFYNEDDFK